MKTRHKDAKVPEKKIFMNPEEPVTIRAYSPADKDSLLELIKLNIPHAFAAEEADEFSRYLDQDVELYYVLRVKGDIVGCGGINFAQDKSIGKMSWDIIHPHFQRKSLGARLWKHRLEVLRSIDSVRKITVRTSQTAFKFYERQGFVLRETKKDYWAKGFDLYYMEYDGI